MLKIAVIGAGWVTPARHIPALQRSGRCEIIGVIDRHVERAREVAARFGLAHFGSSLQAPWLAEAQACTVGVSPMSHFEVADALLDQGKHVLLEKPMCLAVEEGEALLQKATSKGLTLAIVHNFQFARSALRAKAKLAKGAWGKVIGLHAFQLSSPQRRLPTWYEKLPLGLFYDESPHLLYLLKAFDPIVGPASSPVIPNPISRLSPAPSSREGKGESGWTDNRQPATDNSFGLKLRRASIVPSPLGKTTPAVVQAEFDSRSGWTATLFMNFEAPVSEWHLFVFTEAGAAVIDIFRDILVFVPADGQHTARDVTRSSLAMLWGHATGFIGSGWRMLRRRLLYGNEEVVRRFLDAVERQAELQDIDAQSALEILKLQHAIIKSGQEAGGKVADAFPITGCLT